MSSGQIDQVSAAIGRMEAYVHEHRHEVNNLHMKLDGLQTVLAQQIATMDAKIDVRLKAIEVQHVKDEYRDNLLRAIIKSPFVAWILGGLVTIWAFITGKLHF